jgi:hypothetical protein
MNAPMFIQVNSFGGDPGSLQRALENRVSRSGVCDDTSIVVRVACSMKDDRTLNGSNRGLDGVDDLGRTSFREVWNAFD